MSQSMVTGVAGFIGSTLAESILANGGKVVGVDSLTDYYSTQNKRKNLESLMDYDGFTLIKSDLAANTDEIYRAINESRYIYHQAGQPQCHVACIVTPLDLAV